MKQEENEILQISHYEMFSHLQRAILFILSFGISNRLMKYVHPKVESYNSVMTGLIFIDTVSQKGNQGLD